MPGPIGDGQSKLRIFVAANSGVIRRCCTVHDRLRCLVSSMNPTMHRAIVSLLLLLPLLSLPLFGQETVFDVPSPDILDRGKIYGELDGTARPVNPLYTFEPRMVVGVGRGIEAGLNFIGLSEPASGEAIIAPTVKWRLWDGGTSGWSFFAGDDIFFAVRKANYDAGNYFYAEFAKVFHGGTRIGFGGYDFTKNVVAPAQRAGGQFTFEQSLNKRLTVAAEWYTGKQDAGYFDPGVVVKATPKLTLYGCYQIGNAGVTNGNHQFLWELGYNFN
jgi:hypothetical protein